MSNVAVFGIYNDRNQAENAVATLRGAGFRQSDISLLLSDVTSASKLVPEKGSKASEGMAAGVGTGAAMGGALGWLAGIGAIAIPGLGPLIAAGPIMGLLAGAGVGGAIGGITGVLIGLGIPEYKAKAYETRIREGKVLVSVHCDDHDWVRKAEGYLEDTGAEDISSSTESAPPQKKRFAS